MRRPRHAADGSFGRAAGMAAGRGAALLVVALALGIVLLNAADDPPAEQVTAGTPDDAAPVATSTSVAPTTAVTTPARAPKDIKVISANGTTVKGLARKVTDQLKSAGYNVLAPTDAAQRVEASAVYFTGDFEREAQAVAAILELPPTAVQSLPNPPPVPDGRGANVVVVIGPELAQRLATTATTTTTATTAAGGATATTTKR